MATTEEGPRKKKRVLAAPRQSRGNACLKCHDRKLRCDGVRPICGPCTRLARHVPCTFPTYHVKARTEILEDKIRSLEEQIARLQTASSPSPDPQPSSPAGPDVLHASPQSPAAIPLDGLPQTLAPPVPAIIGSWWETQGNPPSGLTTLLKATVYKSRSHFIFHAPQFLKSLALPHGEAPHPALLNAVYLIGCYFHGSEKLASLEPLFLQRTRRQLTLSLQNVDNLASFVKVSVLLSWYYYVKGRFIEGHHCSSSTMRFAVACGLNRLPSSISQSTDVGGLLEAPTDIFQLSQRIRLWWHVFLVDRGGSVLTGLPAALPDDEIDTPWPVPLAPDTDGTFIMSPLETRTVRSLYQAETGATLVSDDHVNVLRLKNMALMERASRLGKQATDKERILDDKFWVDFYTTDQAISQFVGSLPSIYDLRQSESLPSSPPSSSSPSSSSSSPSPPHYEPPQVNLFLIMIHTLARSAAIELHNGLALTDVQTSYDICLKAAREAAALVYKIVGFKGEDIPFFLQLYWARIVRVLGREFVRLRRVGEPNAANAVWFEIDNLLLAINRTVGASAAINFEKMCDWEE
ncbi:hypothetical protein BOTBODRAFT_64333 [Botryobasidium botryosum FD-172 SS1]|uniref:Zn(2)-C6 fungal-type domain-containing protein n=1 Tax=Botryobasidium botryosum (strain FD-172 SS1) TaxID=930990 RepID=A0A067MZQ2_BOTB1|nr:hypothetical protein BOTBODRAFT_64333 [Botryobasidium botryosum FD-172 SS1]